ncbi:hypothetical protein TSUD_204690 [Trifolium subterraneum]|uniref:Uncharacterized protein n=1 Tax=Trifolium subterraneum TaxID=3900 RepID=A0A2Z6N010_TRISU|nr:hypothetical protein TSUD_204690 [Trifolium subterraneum]
MKQNPKFYRELENALGDDENYVRKAKNVHLRFSIEIVLERKLEEFEAMNGVELRVELRRERKRN